MDISEIEGSEDGVKFAVSIEFFNGDYISLNNWFYTSEGERVGNIDVNNSTIYIYDKPHTISNYSPEYNEESTNVSFEFSLSYEEYVEFEERGATPYFYNIGATPDGAGAIGDSINNL